MSPLKQKIIGSIKSKGPISFEEFMNMALYYPELGYYTKDSTKIGRAGDFYTSSHLHPIFGAMLGRQMEEMWEAINRPDVFNIAEMGAGMGYVAKDMLAYLEARGKGQEALFEHLKYTIIELNPLVKTRQQELLSGFADKVHWVSDLRQLEPGKGCFLSNELLDAFPVRVVEMDGELKEIHVSVAGENFREVKLPCSKEVEEYFKEFSVTLHEGYRTEVCLRVKDWLREVAEKVLGFIVTIDYGYPAWDYYSEDRNRGTLLCYYQHQVNENPYQNIGEQDLTAHVNFSALKKWGEEMGMQTLGFCTQGAYLVSLGIDAVISELGYSEDAFELAKIKGLILPQGMGESHKVLIQSKGIAAPKLSGFDLRNQLANL